MDVFGVFEEEETNGMCKVIDLCGTTNNNHMAIIAQYLHNVEGSSHIPLSQCDQRLSTPLIHRHTVE